jgi:lysophospholipase L1-like esterase
MYRLTKLTRVAAVGAVMVLAACQSNRDVLQPTLSGGNEIFRRYVAIGNSLTAGWQSDGINDDTQRQSYPRLLAGQMGTQYHYASLNLPGCQPPVVNFVTQARAGGAAAGTCALRAPGSVTDILNNVGVPDARVLDPTTPSTVASNILTTLILGGKTQVQRALDARPTFVSIWIGNNDVLRAGYTGLLTPSTFPPNITSPGIVSTQAQFQASYDLMLKQLLDSMPSLKGVLIGVAQVSSIPLMTQGAVVYAARAGLAPIVVNPNCNGSTALVTLPLLVPLIRAGGHPAQISCVKGVDPTDPRVGDVYVLDDQERVALAAAIDAYNAYIKAKAQTLGFAYWDPNPALGALRGTPASLSFPNFSSPTNPFGTAFSLDGVHPTLEGQKLIANNLITTINTTYGSALQAVP